MLTNAQKYLLSKKTLVGRNKKEVKKHYFMYGFNPLKL